MSEEYCVPIKKRTRRGCVEPDCTANARDKTGKCVRHGGGNRCDEPGCQASARGNTGKCIAHGGGNRCDEPNCQASARDNTGKCKAHGGGNRCDCHNLVLFNRTIDIYWPSQSY